MSDYAYLISNSTPQPAGCNDDGSSNYSSGETISEGGSYIFPLLWLTAFRPADLVTHAAEDSEIVCPVILREAALANLAGARELVCGEFPSVEAHWLDWEAMVSNSKGRYLKIDATEIWGMDPNGYNVSLPKALAWFSSRAESDRDALLEFCGLNFDDDSRALTLGLDPVTADNLYGMLLTQ